MKWDEGYKANGIIVPKVEYHAAWYLLEADDTEVGYIVRALRDRRDQILFTSLEQKKRDIGLDSR